MTKATFIMSLILFVAAPSWAAQNQGLKWSSFGFDIDQTGTVFFLADADGKIQDQGQKKKRKIEAEFSLPVTMDLQIIGRNPVSGKDLKDIMPVIVGGMKAPAELTAVFGNYVAKMSTIGVFLGMDAIFEKTDSNQYYIRSVVGRNPTWGDLIKRGSATLTVSPYKEAQPQVHWYEIIKGQRKEIEQPAGIQLP